MGAEEAQRGWEPKEGNEKGSRVRLDLGLGLDLEGLAEEDSGYHQRWEALDSGRKHDHWRTSSTYYLMVST